MQFIFGQKKKKSKKRAIYRIAIIDESCAQFHVGEMSCWKQKNYLNKMESTCISIWRVYVFALNHLPMACNTEYTVAKNVCMFDWKVFLMRNSVPKSPIFCTKIYVCISFTSFGWSCEVSMAASTTMKTTRTPNQWQIEWIFR